MEKTSLDIEREQAIIYFADAATRLTAMVLRGLDNEDKAHIANLVNSGKLRFHVHFAALPRELRVYLEGEGLGDGSPQLLCDVELIERPRNEWLS